MSTASAPAKIATDIALSLVFFTRLPLPVLDFGDRKLADAIWAAPIAGVVVAVIGAAVFTLATSLGVGPGPAAALALAAMIVSTGSLHEDGFSDVADGFGGGLTPERKLEIMHDSRIGAYGACALGLSILIRWSALAEFSSGWSALLALVAAQARTRLPRAACWAHFFTGCRPPMPKACPPASVRSRKVPRRPGSSWAR